MFVQRQHNSTAHRPLYYHNFDQSTTTYQLFNCILFIMDVVIFVNFKFEAMVHDNKK